MGAGGSARGSRNSKCVKRRGCPRATRGISPALEGSAEQRQRSSYRFRGQQKHKATFCPALAEDTGIRESHSCGITESHPEIPLVEGRLPLQLKAQQHLGRG